MTRILAFHLLLLALGVLMALWGWLSLIHI